jgi:penicillin-binding protein 1A
MYNQFSKIIIKAYCYLINSILSGKYILLKSFVLLSLLASINFFLLVASFKDIEIIKKALEYETPTTLFGVNKNGDYEPIAEFYQFSRIVHKLPDFKEEKASYDKQNKVLQCFISTEDNNFYSHFGIDIRGIIRAFAVNILAGKIKEGASTITQQVARLKFLSIDRSFIRKAREAWLSLLMEKFYSKDTILEMYMNEIPLGHGTHGVGAAARFYFRKDINSLNWGEAALLASLTTRPKEFSPLVNPNLSSAKVRVVFMKLIENGKLDIKTAEAEYKKFSNYYLNLNRSPNDSAYSDRLNRFPYFTEYVRRNLKKIIPDDELYNGGLKVYSTLNIEHQIAAEKVLTEGLINQTKVSNQRIFRNVDIFDDTFGDAYNLISLVNDTNDFRFKITREERTFRSIYQEEMREELSMLNLLSGSDSLGIAIDENFIRQAKQDHLLPVEGALLSIRPHTGYITAMVGGSGFKSGNQQIRTIQAFRQPGSSFKPLVYASVLDYFGKNPDKDSEKNITPSTVFLDSPLHFLMEDGDEWLPENYSEEYSGFIRLRAALESSRNSVAVRVVEQTGISKIFPTITSLLKINREIPKNFSVALGTFEISPFEITRAYAILASGGKEVHPISVLYIEDNKGSILKDFREEHKNRERKQILSPESAFLITNMMEDVIKKGTGKAVLQYGLGRTAAGKTGTTNNFRDAWFVGYTPELVSSIWMGYDSGTISLGRGMAGGVVATPIWAKYMAQALKNEKVQEYTFLKDLNLVVKRVCSRTGKLSRSANSEGYNEYFIKGTEPKAYCDEVSYSNITESPTIDLPPDVPSKKVSSNTNSKQNSNVNSNPPPKKKKKKKEVLVKEKNSNPSKKTNKKSIFQGDDSID